MPSRVPRALGCASQRRQQLAACASRNITGHSHQSSQLFAGRTSALQPTSYQQTTTQHHLQARCQSTSTASKPHTPATSFTPLPTSIHLTPDNLYVDHSLPSNFTKVLIANRGEIACRVIRTCKLLNIKTVAVYSDSDNNSQHVQLADEAYYIGASPARQSYLDVDKILDVAKRSGAQAVHPGYGFLSENSHFAQRCSENNIEFIGPPTSAIESMGSKSASKQIMINAGVPVIPGYHDDSAEGQSTERLQQEAQRVGFPLMIKAISGGGGKGMRICHKPEDFAEQLESCQRESQSSFNDSRVLLERYIQRPRHIEFQVFADKHGNAVHLFERDCSVQRRHQKVLEEAPAPGMSDEMRRKMGTAATDAAKAVNYVGAGTVEFIFDTDTDDYFFMEMNTRLQVEHPVSEMIMRKDFVQWQLHVAYGYELPCTQDDIYRHSHHGYAIEARIYAESPANNFLPQTGTITYMQTPATNSSVRIESGIVAGDTVSIYYDPMIAKLIVWGPSRDTAINGLITALQQYHIVGMQTNIEFVIQCLNHQLFRKGQVNTSFIAQNQQKLLPAQQTDVESPATAIPLTLAALYLLLQQQLHQQLAVAGSVQTSDRFNPYNNTDGWRVNQPYQHRSLQLQSKHFARDSETNEMSEASELFDVIVTTDTYHKHGEYAVSILQPSAATTTTEQHTSQPHLVNVRTAEIQPIGGTAAAMSARIRADIDQQQYNADVVFNATDHTLHVFLANPPASTDVTASLPATHYTYTLPTKTYGRASAVLGGPTAPMSGKIVKVSVKANDLVKKGQSIVIMEAMKMEHVIRAPTDGVVESVLYSVGDFVEGGKPVVTFKAAAEK